MFEWQWNATTMKQWQHGAKNTHWNIVIGNILKDTWEQKLAVMDTTLKQQKHGTTAFVVHDTHMRMVRVSDKRITGLQKECDKLKGDIEGCRAKMRKLQQQLMNEDVHRGWNTLRTCDFDLYDHSNQGIITRFCKNKLFSHPTSFVEGLQPQW